MRKRRRGAVATQSLTKMEIASGCRPRNDGCGCGKIATARGSRQVVRHQPSKLIFVGSNPISRSF